MTKPAAPPGSLGMRLGDDGALWFGMYYQAAIARYDRTSGAVQTWPLAPNLDTPKTQINQVAPAHTQVDGKVWLQNAGIVGVHRLTLATGSWETWTPFANVPGSHNPRPRVPMRIECHVVRIGREQSRRLGREDRAARLRTDPVYDRYAKRERSLRW